MSSHGRGYRAALLALLAVSALSACSRNADIPAPRDGAPAQLGADRRMTSSGITADRRNAGRDTDSDAPTDESRGKPIGSIVPRESPLAKEPPAVPPPATQP